MELFLATARPACKRVQSRRLAPWRRRLGEAEFVAYHRRHPSARPPGIEDRMTRQRISSGSRFEDEIGYSRGVVVDGEWVFLSGTTGYDYAAMTIAPDVVEQCEQTFRNIEAALAKADARIDDIVEAWFIVPNPADWQPCWPVLKKWLGVAKPTSTLFHAQLYTPEMRIEIKVTARRGLSAAPAGAAVTVERIDHLVLTCADLEATAAWYARVLGMARVTFGDPPRVALRFGDQKINLHQAGREFSPRARIALPGSADLCLITRTPPDALAAHLAACGVAVELGPVPKDGALGPLASIYVRDPDGNLVEIASYPHAPNA
jgi:enamine deaminase RidA (YjgF/YER057c/UK114 family)/catechol 2,3-dioxygenase-like lactoylglutathione lyase family enzyme